VSGSLPDTAWQRRGESQAMLGGRSWVSTCIDSMEGKMMTRVVVRSLAVLGVLLATLSVHAADVPESRPVHFAKGASSATVKGSIKGYKTIDYKLRARAGQTMSVKLETSNGANYFNVLPPGSNDVAVHVGSTSGNEWSGALQADGEYTVRVYLMRSAARRNETANYSLTVGITGSAAASPALGAAPPSDAKVKGTPYHATGQVPCSIGAASQSPMQCDFGVIRGKPGNAEVHVTPPGGLERVLTFMGSKVTSTDGAKVKATKKDYTWSIEVNDVERYEIPEAVVSGG